MENFTSNFVCLLWYYFVVLSSGFPPCIFLHYNNFNLYCRICFDSTICYSPITKSYLNPILRLLLKNIRDPIGLMISWFTRTCEIVFSILCLKHTIVNDNLRTNQVNWWILAVEHDWTICFIYLQFHGRVFLQFFCCIYNVVSNDTR